MLRLFARNAWKEALRNAKNNKQKFINFTLFKLYKENIPFVETHLLLREALLPTLRNLPKLLKK